MRIDIHQCFDDHEPVLIGTLEYKGQLLENAEKLIHDEWPKFQATEPESSADFVSWLAERHKMFRPAAPNEVIKVNDD